MHSRWRIVGAVALVPVAVLVLVSLDLLDAADKIASVIGALAGVAALVLAWSQWSGRSASGDPLERLAGLVADRWTAEAGRRGLTGVRRMAVGWRRSDRELGVALDEVFRGDPQPVGPGVVDDLVALWRRLPSGRLVVTGGPGAGKTSAAVLFTCALLDGREAGDPVPVLVDAVGWRPGAGSFESWLGRTVADRYGRRVGAREIEGLIRSGRVVPVLDGFDEMRPVDRPRLMAAFRERPRLGVVLTSRIGEYAATVADGDPLLEALVVELEPLAPNRVAGYLTAGQAGGTQRWAPVRRRLTGDGGGTLRAVLSNPLMAYLARTVYRRPGSRPEELAGFGRRGEMERRLLAGYLPVIYDEPERPARWLTFLAGSLQRRGETSFAWWRLTGLVDRPSRLARVVNALIGALPPAVVAATVFEWRFAVLVGWVLFSAGYLIDGAAAARPWRVRFRRRAFLTSIAGGLAAMLPLALGGMLPPVGGPVSLAVVTAVLAGLAVWLARVPLGFIGGRLRWWRRVEDPGTRLPVPGAAGPALAYLCGLVLLIPVFDEEPLASPLDGVAVALLVLFLIGLPGGLLYGLAVGFVERVPEAELHGPDLVLRDDRSVLWMPPVLMVATFGVMAAVAEAWLPAGASIRVSLTFALMFGLWVWSAMVVLPGASWITFTVVRSQLAVRGDLPWRLMEFLAGAADRGVLRRDGAVYRFRHERLQTYLAGGVTEPLPGAQN
ncbi:NACHT domain-containing protein [Actinoplanes campanulatus]|uniref:NACHT domain-containing protein n=1 Tax=Actinoplanes campanulatus TaxID=113559 RepID=UPI0019539725|nr:hypothetical protein [Actinoplanes capillaceus]